MGSAIIVGCAEQNGRLLHGFLSERGDPILGIGWTFTRSTEPGWTQPIEITGRGAVFHAIRECFREEVCFLAALHQCSEEASGDNIHHFQRSDAVDVAALGNSLSVEILYNHECIYRQPKFVSRRSYPARSTSRTKGRESPSLMISTPRCGLGRRPR